MQHETPPPRDLTLGENRFVKHLEALVTEHAALVPGARVNWKRNAAGDLVLAVIVPAVRL